MINQDQEVSMGSVRAAALAFVAFVLGAHPLFAQEPFRYREFALGTSLASVVTISGARESEGRTLHVRPATIQELEWRTRYARPGTPLVDPVHDVLFSFCDNQLYRLVVTYDRDRMEGLTDDDVIASLSATYGVPLLRNASTARRAMQTDLAAGTMIVAQWEDAASLLTLRRGTYSSPQYQLELISKTLDARARAAIKEALRLDTQEAPQRERDQRTKEVADARVASEKARVVNKAAFRP
jgi:hypothetical protein